MKNDNNQILQRLTEKSIVKQQIYENTLDVFKKLKAFGKEITNETRDKLPKAHKNITVDFRVKGEFEFEMKFAGDLLVATMHTNVFEFPREHEIMKTSYVKEDKLRSYCGIIHFYNFLSDSFKYNRLNDVGYLVGRLFINSEKHFFIEGKRQLGFLYNNFVNEIIDDDAIKKILESTIVYCIDFDLLTPPFDNVKEVSVMEMKSIASNISLKTGKRLGFQFQADVDESL
ncbi:MAG: hypothetical protein K9J13_02775 [Saprospiraceae bacterium]|nr:hypothetical protein [Saprospiraceae bacterium]